MSQMRTFPGSRGSRQWMLPVATYLPSWLQATHQIEPSCPCTTAILSVSRFQTLSADSSLQLPQASFLLSGLQPMPDLTVGPWSKHRSCFPVLASHTRAEPSSLADAI